MATWSDARAIASALPEAEEYPSHGGAPAFRVRRKFFLRPRDGDQILVVKVAPGEHELLTRAEPEKFFVTPHYEGYDYVLVRLAQVEVDELEELVVEAWRLAAPKRLRAAWDAEHPVGD